MTKIKLILICSLFILGACSSSGLKERAELRELLSQGKFAEGLKYVKDSSFYHHKDNALLLNLELGLIHHMAGNYFQSVQFLKKAKEIHKKLFTVSIKNKAQTLVTNDSSDIYYGQSYERSLIHFYLSLNHYTLYQLGKYEAYVPPNGDKVIPEKTLSKDEVRRELMAARAEILDWDSYLKWISNDRKGKSVFKNDMLSKVFGGIIHEALNTRNDEQIALQLYKDAMTLLFRNYNAYSTFNKSAKKFKSDFKKLPSLKKSEVKKNYISETDYQKSLSNYLVFKILKLTKKLRPNEFKKLVGIYKPSKKVLAKLKKSNKDSNVAVVLQRGFIPKKKSTLQYYSLEKALTPKNPTAATKAIAKFGASVIMIFAANELGLLPPPTTFAPIGMELGVRTAMAASNHLAISFELPEMEKKIISEKTVLAVFDSAGKKVMQRSVPLINPLIDIATEAIAEDSASRYGRIGFRLATKHLTAIAASYGTYKLAKDKMGRFLAKQAAAVQYMGASKAIGATEKADTRYWSTLPADFRILDFYLPKGTYQFKLEVYKGNKKAKSHRKVIDLGKHTVNGAGKTLLNLRAI